MTGASLGPVSFWRTVWLLLRAAQRRGRARQRRQRALLYGAKRGGAGTMNALGLLGAVVFAAAAHALCWTTLDTAVRIGAYRDAERDGKMLVGAPFMHDAFGTAAVRDDAVRIEAWRRQRAFGGDHAAEETILRHQLETQGRDGFVVSRPDASDGGIATIARAGRLGFATGLVVVAVWFVMIAFQGEGLELDVQRRRHPMWEWLFSHPIHPGAAFLAEMLTPLASNPIFAAAPIFWGLTFGSIHGTAAGLTGGVVVGVSMAVAASCFSKTLEITAMLRLSPRSRSAVLSILSWIGYSTLMLTLFAGSQRGILVALVSAVDHASTMTPVTPARWMFGVTSAGRTSVTLAVATCVTLSATVAAASVWLSARATDAGIAGGFTPVSRALRTGSAGLGIVRDPLIRKELLWLSRDRGALVQALLIPLTMGAMQAFNLSSIARQAGASWNWFCGLAVLAGTYFLLALGPRSLASEGSALWIALTWPRGLEPLLKAKARLWWVVGSVVVLSVIAVALVRFPGDAAKILLVAGGWMFFGRSLAEKTVTLVVAPSSSGEPEPIPRGRQWAAMLGTFSFASGVITRNWHVAALGVAFSTLTAAAMWQNFRARLPYLFDPGSERLPPAPSLMHAMIAVTAMVDGMGIIAIPIAFGVGRDGGRDGMWATQAAAYGLAALLTWVVTSVFLEGRGVTWRQIATWPASDLSPVMVAGRRFWRRLPAAGRVGMAAGLGALLAGLALGYRWGLSHVPAVAPDLVSAETYLAAHPREKWALVLLSVGFAPMAEEYLFRGLLFRALDREWGGWRAVLGSALFFAVYHPPTSWIPVGLAGLVLAVLFKASGRLWPCVILHTTYNAIVVLTV